MAGGGPEAANTVAELRPALELVDDDGNPNWIPDVSVMDLEDVEGFGLGDNEADDGDDEDERLAKAGFFPYEA